MPDCIFLHFEQGLNLEKFQELDVGHYAMMQFIQYKRNPDHFSCWTRDIRGTRVLHVKCVTLKLKMMLHSTCSLT